MFPSNYSIDPETVVTAQGRIPRKFRQFRTLRAATPWPALEDCLRENCHNHPTPAPKPNP